MRRFVFRLQSILNMREHLEDERRVELGAITSRCAELDRRLSECRSQAHSALVAPAEASMDLDWLRRREAAIAFAARLTDEAARVAEERRRAEDERTAAVERYRDARRDAEVLRKLRARRLESYSRDRTRDEQKRVDEVAQQMHRAGGVNGNTI